MRALAPLLLFTASVLACTELPGEVIGTYRVTMKLEENTCGTGAVNLLDGHRYAVELRSDAQYGYWRIPDQPLLQGSYDPPNFRFENSGLVAQVGAEAGPRGCALRQVDLLTGKLTKLPDAGSEDPDAASEEPDDLVDAAGHDASDEDLDAGAAEESSDEDAQQDAATNDKIVLRGEHTFTVSAAAGTDCASALPPVGPFDKLPCTVRYSVIGINIKPF
jgi:hypothetical protein